MGAYVEFKHHCSSSRVLMRSWQKHLQALLSCDAVLLPSCVGRAGRSSLDEADHLSVLRKPASLSYTVVSTLREFPSNQLHACVITFLCHNFSVILHFCAKLSLPVQGAVLKSWGSGARLHGLESWLCPDGVTLVRFFNLPVPQGCSEN
jgi:hypothetical protein